LPKAPLPANELARLEALRALDVLDTPAEVAFDRITRAAANYLNVPICLVSLVDEKRQWFKSRHGLDAQETHRDMAFCAHTILTDEPLVVPDASLDDRFVENLLVTGDLNVQFYAGVPLSLTDNIRVGTLCVIDHKPRELVAKEREFLMDMAAVIVDQFKLRQALSDVREAALQREFDQGEIRDQARRADIVLETFVDGIVTIDANGIVHSFNPGAERIFGYVPAEVIGQNVKMLMPEPYKARHDAYLSAYLTTGEAKIIGRGRELVGLNKNGTKFPMELGISEMKIDDVTMFTGIVRDITEKQQFLYQIESARAIAEKANLAKSEFLSSMSHELRTPMNSVLGFSQILLTDPDHPLTDDQMESVHQISNAGKHLLELINDVLDLSRIEAGKVELKIENLSLKDLLSDCYHLMSPQSKTAGLTLELQAFEDCTVAADEVSLKQVVLNLLSNAIKYNRDGGMVSISVPAVAGEHVLFAITDSGIGIPESRIAELFQPFNRLGAEQGNIEGTGVGLVITKQLLELMNGSIEVVSQPGNGTVFTVALPFGSAE
jgi:PAS domain S-box-containing protein